MTNRDYEKHPYDGTGELIAVTRRPPSSRCSRVAAPVSDVLIGGGFVLIGSAWDVLYKAQRAHQVATTGPYAYLRHPQYVGFIVIMLGFLIQWPTLIILIMFPILVTMYIRLARREEREALAEFGEAYAAYAAITPAFFPRRPQTIAGGLS